jgi:[ribosomal protein S18]-alanine N-acetyltransferase
MLFHFKPMTVDAANAIAQWHYPGIYKFYDLDEDPEDHEEFLDPDTWENALFAVVNEGQELVGFFLFEQEDDSLELGLGLHPAYTGKGNGEAFILAGLKYANQQFQPSIYHLSVATFNQRAIRLYERLGFVKGNAFIQQTNGGDHEFIRMTKPNEGV